jgi:hypothetical protein
MLVKRLPDQGLDYSLAADVQFLSRGVQLVQHWRREVNIHTPNWAHHVPRVCEETRDILSLVSETRNVFGRHRLLPLPPNFSDGQSGINLITSCLPTIRELFDSVNTAAPLRMYV